MDNRLQNLLGYDSNIGYMLALSKSGKYMMSRNGGDNWSSISLKHFNTVRLFFTQILLPIMMYLLSFPAFVTLIVVIA